MIKLSAHFLKGYTGKEYVRYRKANAPCPRCGSWSTVVENNIFVCHNCGFEGG